MIAHCAISDPQRGRLWQDQRIRRAGLGLAEVSENDTNVWIEDWSLKHAGPEYRAVLAAEDFALDLHLADTQAPLINGVGGLSRKGPAADAASYYYSLPHMQVHGAIARAGKREIVTGEAWFDHEWSSEYLDPQASGWDWIGINMDDGSALMAFRIRGSDGAPRWAGGTLRDAGGRVQILENDAVTFHAVRDWTSPRTGIKYPVQWQISVNSRRFELQPLLDDQENDTRLSTGAIYWEGAVECGRTATHHRTWLPGTDGIREKTQAAMTPRSSRPESHAAADDIVVERELLLIRLAFSWRANSVSIHEPRFSAAVPPERIRSVNHVSTRDPSVFDADALAPAISQFPPGNQSCTPDTRLSSRAVQR